MEKESNKELSKELIILKECLENRRDYLKRGGYHFKLVNQIACLDDLINILNQKDYDAINASSLQISMDLYAIFEEEEAKEMEKDLLITLRNIKIYKNEPVFAKEYSESIRKFKEFRSRFQDLSNELKEKNEKLRKNINTCEKYMYKLESNQRFGKEQVEEIYDILVEEEYNVLAIAVIIDTLVSSSEKIKSYITPRDIHNSNVKKEKFQKVNNACYYEVFNIKLAQALTTKEVSELGSKVDNIIHCWDEYYKDNNFDFDAVLPTLNNLPKDKLYIFYNMLMHEIQNQKIDAFQFFLDKDTIFNYKDKKDAVFMFNKYEKLFLHVRDFYEELFDKLQQQEALKRKETEKEPEEVTDDKNGKILFLRNNYDETFMMKNLKKMNPEYLPKVSKLLEERKKGISKERKEQDKSITSNDKFKQIGELKDDQVRICYKNLNDGRIIITGCDIKKADVDYNMLKRNAKRFKDYYKEEMLDYYIEKSEEDFQECIDYCEKNKRKGSR